jgi:hypothetical protein
MRDVRRERRRWWRERSTAGWRTVLVNEADRLGAELDQIPRDGSVNREIAERAIERMRESAAPPIGLSERVMDWFGGAQIERGWTARNLARSALLALRDDAGLAAQIPSVRRSVLKYVEADDLQRDAFLQELDSYESAGPPFDERARLRLRAIRDAADHASDDRQRAVRRFRNLLVLTAFALLVALVGLAAVHAADPALTSVCGPRSLGQDRCLAGAQPAAMDVAAVEALGLVGGLVAALIPLARTRRPQGPYSLWGAQIALKATSGAATGLVGLLLLQSGLVLGLSPQPGPSALGYAALFGAAQHLFTRFVDAKAAELGAG